VKVHCRTNLDLHYEVWPDELPCVPRVGDYVASCIVHPSGFRLELEVYNVTFYQNNPPVIELHIKKFYKWSIKEFYEWYAPIVGKSVGSFI
jgi:hypothetical protein